MKRKKVLFICSGNTCRSPMAEIMFRAEIKARKIKFVDVASAGLFVEKDAVINPNSARCLQELGLDYSKFKPRQLKHKVLETSFLAVCMTLDQKELFDHYDNVLALRDLIGKDAPDPYGGDLLLYRQTAAILKESVLVIIEKYFS